LAFKKLLALRGVKRGKGGNRGNQHLATATVAVAKVAAELGVSERTARHRVALADAYEALPLDLKRKVDKP
jgi:hypothetical protein